MASLVSPDYPDSPFCGAVILSPSDVLTTAGCLLFKREADIAVRVGTHDLRDEDKAVSTVESFIQHPGYSYNPFEDDGFFSIPDRSNDFALLRLSDPLDLDDDRISRICMPSMEER